VKIYVYEFFFVNPQNLQHQLTHELAIQREENGQIVFRIQNKAAAKDIPELFHFWLNGSFRQFFKAMMLSGKAAFITTATKSRNCIRI
jgi:hypothetical protein